MYLVRFFVISSFLLSVFTVSSTPKSPSLAPLLPISWDDQSLQADILSNFLILVLDCECLSQDFYTADNSTHLLQQILRKYPCLIQNTMLESSFGGKNFNLPKENSFFLNSSNPKKNSEKPTPITEKKQYMDYWLTKYWTDIFWRQKTSATTTTETLTTTETVTTTTLPPRPRKRGCRNKYKNILNILKLNNSLSKHEINKCLNVKINWKRHCILSSDFEPFVYLDMNSPTSNLEVVSDYSNAIFGSNTKDTIISERMHSKTNNFLKQCVTKKTRLWNLDILDNAYDSRFETVTSNDNVEAVDFYVLDSGVLHTHEEFETQQSSRVIGLNRAGEVQNFITNQHGTFIAATATGKRFGVSPHVKRIYARNVCTAVNPYSKKVGCRFGDILIGLELVLSQLQKNKRRGVINLSFSMPKTHLFDSILTTIDHYGGVVVTSAGNMNRDACSRSPASNPIAITVGAHTQNLERRRSSNYGKCVDIYAPGEDVISAWYSPMNKRNARGRKSGTSVATPFVAGVIANYLMCDKFITRDQIVQKLRRHALPLENGPHNTPCRQCLRSVFHCSHLQCLHSKTLFDDDTSAPTIRPTLNPTVQPIKRPSLLPRPFQSGHPTYASTTGTPTMRPSSLPTKSPSSKPSVQPSKVPTTAPSLKPTSQPTKIPTTRPTSQPTIKPTHSPTAEQIVVLKQWGGVWFDDYRETANSLVAWNSKSGVFKGRNRKFHGPFNNVNPFTNNGMSRKFRTDTLLSCEFRFDLIWTCNASPKSDYFMFKVWYEKSKKVLQQTEFAAKDKEDRWNKVGDSKFLMKQKQLCHGKDYPVAVDRQRMKARVEANKAFIVTMFASMNSPGAFVFVNWFEIYCYSSYVEGGEGGFSEQIGF